MTETVRRPGHNNERKSAGGKNQPQIGMRRVQNAALFALQRPELASAIYDSNVWKQRYCSDNADGKNHRCALEFASFYRNHNPSETNSEGDEGVEVKRLNREQRYNRRQDRRPDPARLKRQLPNQGEDEDDTHHAEAVRPQRIAIANRHGSGREHCQWPKRRRPAFVDPTTAQPDRADE